MAVKLEQLTRRYIGLSTDLKPARAPEDTVPAGSSFLEADTGRIYRWTGAEWLYTPHDDDATAILQAILIELTRLRTLVELATS